MKREELPPAITYGSVCSGIEAATVAWHPLGWRAVWLAEIEPFPARVLHHHYGAGRPLHMPDPDEHSDGLTQSDRDERRAAIKAVSVLPQVTVGPRNLGDMTKIAAMVRAGLVSAPDVLVGGTPCQAFSIAGLRESLSDARGQLTLSFVDLANAIDAARHVLGLDECIINWENVPGVLSTKDNAFGCFLGALAGEDSPLLPPGGKWPNAGCVFGPQRRIAWRVLDAQYFGVAQRRRRVFVVASARDGFDPAEVLFEQDGVRRDSPPSRQAQEDVTGTVRASAGRRGGVQDESGLGLQVVAAPSLARCDTAGEGRRQDYETCTIVPVLSAPVQRSVERPRGDGGDTLIAGTLQANGKAAGSATQQDAEAGMLVVARSVALRGREGGATAELGDEVANSLRCGGGGGDKAHVLAPIAFSMKDYGGDASFDLAPTLRAGNHSTSHANGGQPPAIAFDARQDCVSSTEVFGALGSSSPQAQAVCIHADAVGRTGDAITPSVDAEGRVRLRNPGVGVIDDGTSYNLMAHGRPHAICITGDVAHTLKAEGFDASEDGTGRGQPIIATASRQVAGCITSNYGKQIDNSDTALGPNVAIHGMAVRRLTPRECERLQSFPDFHTLIPMSKVKASRAETLLIRGEPVAEIDGQWWKLSADGPRYKALGNSMCAFNMRWIGRRIHFAITGARPHCANFTREMGMVVA